MGTFSPYTELLLHRVRGHIEKNKLINEYLYFYYLFQPDYYRDSPSFQRQGEGNSYRLEIPHAKLDFTGTYSVVARNVHGEAKAVISLQIFAKGKIVYYYYYYYRVFVCRYLTCQLSRERLMGRQ